VTVFDSGSTDGSLEQAEAAGATIVRVAAGSYVPGRVLNEAMRVTSSEVVAFVNADAVPANEASVAPLVDACRAGAAAAYARQVPRPGSRAITVRDHERAFPPDARGPRFRHFFSMAASAIRRDVWEALPFDERFRYSEDVDWSLRVRGLGRDIAYVPEAVFEHSHDYGVRATWRRMEGEGRADAMIWREGPGRLARHALGPFGAALLRDAASGALGPASIALRAAACAARFVGLRAGAENGAGEHGGPRQARPEPPDRLTLCGDPRAEQAVEQAIRRASAAIVDELDDRVLALVLVGGFGAGEGAVDQRGDDLAPHNDLDFVAVVEGRSRARALRGACGRAARVAARAAGAPVDVWPVDVGELRAPAGKLLWVDASVRGLRVVHGSAAVVDPVRRLGARSATRAEHGRLLMNRATGIALSRLGFELGEAERERAARHLAKAWLGLGDVLLLELDRYPASLRDRCAELERLAHVGAPFVGELAAGYARAAAFRASIGPGDADARHVEAEREAMWRSFARLEAHRLCEPVARDAAHYAQASTPRFPRLHDVPAVARLLGGLRAVSRGSVGWRTWRSHPRETLARASALLAFAADLGEARAHAGRLLGTGDSGPRALMGALERLREQGA
jgi:rhamnosyltransferase